MAKKPPVSKKPTGNTTEMEAAASIEAANKPAKLAGLNRVVKTAKKK